MPSPAPNGALPDAATTNWVDRRAPEALKPWLKLGRFDRPIGIWLLLLPGWQGIALALAMEGRAPGLYELWLFAGFAIGACLMRAAGCAFNDIVDRDIDAKVARTAARPVASGRISVRGAWAFVVACSLGGLAVLLTLNVLAVSLGVVSLALVAAYPFMKRITWWPQAWLGLTFNWGALMGYAAAMPLTAALMYEPYEPVELRPLFVEAIPAGYGDLMANPAFLIVQAMFALPGWFLFAGGVFWTLGYDTIYALQDVEDDALVGVRSSARRLGLGMPRGVAGFYAAAAVLAALAGSTARLGLLFYLLLLAYAAHLIWQARSIRLDDAGRALALFRSNREAGLILLAAIILGAWRP